METKRTSTKKPLRSVITAALAIGASALAVNSYAGVATSNLGVLASVSPNCTIDASAGLNFGPYDPVVANAAADKTGAGNIAVTCTNGASTTITLGQGANAAGGSTDAAPLRRLNDGGSNNLDYNLYTDNTYGTVWNNTSGVGYSGVGTSENVTVYGLIPQGQNVPSGSYSDTVVATITF